RRQHDRARGGLAKISKTTPCKGTGRRWQGCFPRDASIDACAARLPVVGGPHQYYYNHWLPYDMGEVRKTQQASPADTNASPLLRSNLAAFGAKLCARHRKMFLFDKFKIGH